VESDFVAVQIQNVGKEAHAGRQGGARCFELCAAFQRALDDKIQRVARVQIEQRCLVSQSLNQSAARGGLAVKGKAA